MVRLFRLVICLLSFGISSALQAEGPLHVAFVIGEDEYQTEKTLPKFAEQYLAPLGVKCTFIYADPENLYHFPDLEKIAEADVLLLSVRRRPLPKAELQTIKDYLKSGKPLVAIRTSSHAFAIRANQRLIDSTLDQWPDFDVDVLGGKYDNHYGNKEGTDVAAASHAQSHPILAGLKQRSFHSGGTLYKCTANKGSTVLLNGMTTDGGKPVTHPVAWTNQYGKSRIFYAALGHVDDFAQPVFNQLLVNALYWATDRPVPTAATGEKQTSLRDTFKNDLAGNADVERVMKSFEGKGEVGDDTEPTPPEEALKKFQVREGFEIELVASEPAVEQPLFMTFDRRGRLWVVQYRQYPFPAGLKVVKYDQYLRAVFDKVPAPPPHGEKGADKITVFEDTDGDGKYDRHKDVITGLNIATAVAVGQGGIWVLNPPYLLFYPDKDGDDVPDSDPEVRLRGFGLEDTHSTANSMKFGPDGWLYGANGSTTTGRVESDGSPPVEFQGQMIWRYHPTTKQFEIFAEGGGNTYSLEIDSKGRIFSGTNAGRTRGMYYPQGSYGEKNWGKHGPLTNPYAFGWFNHMKHEGDEVRFPQTFLIYEGGAFPKEFDGKIIAGNALHNRVWASELIRDGSTYRTKDLPLMAVSSDHWFRPVDVEVGPDGAVYIADWYDSRLTHVDPRDNWHKKSGRIYRLKAKGAKPLAPFDLTKSSATELVDRLNDQNKWFRREVVLELADRWPVEKFSRLADERNRLEYALAGKIKSNAPAAFEALCILHNSGRLSDDLVVAALHSPDEHVRRWAVRLMGDTRLASPADARKQRSQVNIELMKLAMTEPDVQVRVQLAATAKRLGRTRMALVRALASRNEDLDDPHQPLMIWWAIESMVNRDSDGVLTLFEEPAFWSLPIVDKFVVERIMRRFALSGTHLDLQACARLLELAPTDAQKKRLASGFLEAYAGRRIDRLPPTLTKALDDYQASLGNSDLALGLRLGKADAVKEALKIVADEKADKPTRIAYVEILGQTKRPEAMAPLLTLLGKTASHSLKRAALEALMNFDDPQIGTTVMRLYHGPLPDEQGVRTTAQKLLVSRPAWAVLLLQQIDDGLIAKSSLGGDLVQTLSLQTDPAVQKLVAKHWGKIRATPAEKQEQIKKLFALVKSGGGNAAAGHAIYTKKCAVCHTLFGEGGKTGPDLTGYERSNLDFLSTAVVDPSAAIREEFTSFAVVTSDGRTMTGLIDTQDARTVVLRGADNRTVLLNRDDIEELQALPISLMPENQLNDLPEQGVRDLFAYLMSRAPSKKLSAK